MKGTSDSSSIDKTLTALDNYVLLGRSGLRISPLALGTVTFGEEWGYGSNKEESKKVFDAYYEKGGNFFDTANVYNKGESERFLGEYVSDKRSSCVIATKYTFNPEMEAFGNKPSGGRRNPNAGGNHRKNMVESLDESLKRLGTGYVDVLYVHAWEYKTPIYEVMRALDDVVRSGKAHYVAISDAPSWVVASANTMSDLRSLTPFIGLQTMYNLLNRSLESELQPMSAEFGVGIVPWSILADGFLTGKHTRGHASEDSKRIDSTEYFKEEKMWEILDEVRTIARECKRTPAQVAINWILQKPGVTSPLVGARTLSQLQDNLGALEFRLSESQMERLDAVSKPSERPFPFQFTKALGNFVDAGLKVETPRQYQALKNI